MQLDEALERVGRLGRFQITTYVLASSGGFLLVFHAFCMTFIGAEPDHWCRLSDGYGNITADGPRNHTDTGSDSWDQCEQHVRANTSHGADNTTSPSVWSNTSDLVPCQNGWNYDRSVFRGQTIVTQWDLVCGDEYLVPLSNTAYFLGLMVGSVLHTHLSDHFGRKNICLVCFWTVGLFGCVAASSTHIIMFIVFRFLIGTSVQGAVLVSIVYMSELFVSEQRHLTLLVGSTLWSLGFMILPGVAYLVPNWRYLLITISVPFALTIPYYWFLPESLHWLVANDKYEEAEKVLQRAARMNRASLPRHCLTDGGGWDSDCNSEPEGPSACPSAGVESESGARASAVRFSTAGNGGRVGGGGGGGAGGRTANRRKSVIDIARTKPLRPRTAIMFFMWFVNSIVYYGLSMNTSALSGNPYLNCFFSGAAELPSAAVAVWIMKYGRRPQLCGSLLGAGIPLIIMPFIPEQTAGGTELWPVATTLAMLGKFSIAMSFTIVLLYTAEIYPTVVRNAGVGIGSVGARIGGMVAPFATTASKVIPMLPPLVFGGLSVIAAALVFLLPDTFQRVLPEHIEDIEATEMKTVYLSNTPTSEGRRASGKTLIS